jgi:Tol biopolymer transport system component
LKPDGSEIAFVHAESVDGPYKLKVRRSDGGLASDIFEVGPLDAIRSVSWSPNGALLAFTVYRQYIADELVVLDMHSLSVLYRDSLTGSSLNLGFIARVEWSLDGMGLLISGGSDIWGRYHIMGSDGSGLRVSSTTEDMGAISLSSDGTRIAYARRDKGVFLANSDGTRETQVTSQLAYYVRWSPDGKELFFDDAFSRALYRIGVDGTDLQGVEPQGAVPFAPWFPVWAKR